MVYTLRHPSPPAPVMPRVHVYLSVDENSACLRQIRPLEEWPTPAGKMPHEGTGPAVG